MSVPNPAAVRRFACGEALRRNQVTLNPPPRPTPPPLEISPRGHSTPRPLEKFSFVNSSEPCDSCRWQSSPPLVPWSHVWQASPHQDRVGKGFLWKSDACWGVWHPTCSLDSDGYRVNSSGTVGFDWSFWSFWNRSVWSFIKYTKIIKLYCSWKPKENF